MSMNFSLRQQQAVNWDNNRELLVSAAAGSGKTTVLTARIIDRIVNKRIGIDKFLIVTYTRNSADDLKSKLTAALNEKLKETPDDAFLLLQIANIGSAAIGTMHSFCLKVLKEYHEHSAVVLPKNLKILSDEKSTELLDEALDEVFTDLYLTSNAEFERVLDTFASFENDKNVRKYVKNIYLFSLNNEEPYKWLEKMRDRENSAEFETALYDFFGIIARNAVEICDSVLTNYIPQPKGKSKVFTDDIKRVKDLLTKYIACTENADYAGAEIALAEIDFINTTGGSKTDEAIIAQKHVLAFIKDTVLKLLCSDAETNDDNKDMSDIVGTLFDIAVLVGKRFEQKKRAVGAVDYSDMEHMVLNLFNDESVADVYSSKFEHVMFDEYQDCNRLQEKIVKKIAAKAKYFMVGDIKQSIYGFRQAEPKLFLEKYKTYKYDENAEYALIELNENYRSRSNILNAVNRIFFKIMRNEFCGMDYNAQNALNAKKDYPSCTEFDTFENEPVKTVLINNLNKQDTHAKKNAQLLYIIDSIKSMMKTKYVFEPKNNTYRKIKYSDIAILMRSPKKNIPYIREYFAKTEIPVSIQQDTDIRYEPEVNLLVCLLKCIENPYNDIELMTVLHSYIFDVNDAELSYLTAVEGDALISKIKQYAECGTDEILKKKTEYFLKRYANWTEDARYMSADDFIDHLIYDVAYIEYFTAQDNGLRRRANIDALVSRLTRDSDTRGNSLYACVRAIDSIDENGLIVGNDSPSFDSVSVLSMHKSKGLEYPVVFIMDIDSTFSKKDSSDVMLLHKDYGVVSQYIDTEHRLKYKTKEYELMSKLITKTQKEEEQRILYVAMTRAKEHLELVGNISNTAIDKGMYLCDSISYISAANKYSDWILYGICDNKNDYVNVANIKDFSYADFVLCADDTGLYPSHWNIEILEYANGKLTGAAKTVSSSVVLPDPVNALFTDGTDKANSDIELFDYDNLKTKLSYTYPYEEQTKISSKLSVTQIKNLLESDESEYIPDYRTENVKRITVNGNLSATRVGSLYHFFMQHATLMYPYNDEDFNNDIKRMLDKKLITPNEAKIINRNRILPFFNSETGKRIANAKKCEREKNFSYLIDAKSVYCNTSCDDKILIQGVVDCFFEDNNGKYVIIDYKTDAVSQGDENMLALRHKRQIELYKRAIEDIESIKIDECCIFSFVLGKFIPIS